MRVYAENKKSAGTDAFNISQAGWIQVLRALESTRCYSCLGFGHHQRECPTDRRLVNLGEADGVWRSLHNGFLNAMGAYHNRTLKGQKPFGSGPRGRRSKGYQSDEVAYVAKKRIKFE